MITFMEDNQLFVMERQIYWPIRVNKLTEATQKNKEMTSAVQKKKNVPSG